MTITMSRNDDKAGGVWGTVSKLRTCCGGEELDLYGPYGPLSRRYTKHVWYILYSVYSYHIKYRFQFDLIYVTLFKVISNTVETCRYALHIWWECCYPTLIFALSGTTITHVSKNIKSTPKLQSTGCQLFTYMCSNSQHLCFITILKT